jgi:hypothetical protein
MVYPEKQNLNLEKVEHIEISRSFSRKVQLKAFEPIDLFASYTAVMKAGATQEDINMVSNQLFEKAKADVEKQLSSYKLDNTNPGF